ncbi:response regulator [Persephonella sp.]
MKKILIIDDNSQNRLLIKMVLQKKGYSIIEAEGGMEGINTARQMHPDLILLDMMMPEIDGWKVLQMLKEDSETKNIPVVVFTALDSIENIESIQQYIKGIIYKPLDINRLYSVIEKAVK